jgi:hypothetical protein
MDQRSRCYTAGDQQLNAWRKNYHSWIMAHFLAGHRKIRAAWVSNAR